MSLDNIYNKVITQQSNSKKNKHHIDNPTVAVMGENPSCGDEILIELRIEGDVVKDAAFTGVSCAISQASSSIMVDLFKGRSISEVEILFYLFINMIQRKITDENELTALGDAVALKNISNMPARVKCAAMPWYTAMDAIKQAMGS